jgi:formylmethanofuran--tetrahydromethanopterin N-formyltransferase
MELNGVEIEDTFCEAFGGFFTRILITAKNEKWARIAAQVSTGYGTSTIHCDAEGQKILQIIVLGLPLCFSKQKKMK